MPTALQELQGLLLFDSIASEPQFASDGKRANSAELGGANTGFWSGKTWFDIYG